jgi:hypothetical protein
VSIEKGVGTFPIYLRRLHGALFADAGNAFFGSFDSHSVRYGIGADLRLNFKIAYRIESTLSVGIAKGLSKGGVTDYYMVSAFPF